MIAQLIQLFGNLEALRKVGHLQRGCTVHVTICSLQDIVIAFSACGGCLATVRLSRAGSNSPACILVATLLVCALSLLKDPQP